MQDDPDQRPERKELGRDMTPHDRSELATIMGRHFEEIDALLGYTHGPVAVHRNDLILVDNAEITFEVSGGLN